MSGEIRNVLVRWGVKPDRVRVLLNGIDPDAFRRTPGETRRIRNALGIGPGEVVVGAVGRLEPEKRFDVLLEAVARLLPRHPELRLMIVGEGTLRADLLLRAERLGIGRRCVLLGHRSDMVDLYQAFDLFVQSSDHEGSPTVVVEAMAMETPVVATAVGGTKELIEHGVHGLLVPRRDPEAMEAAIEATLDDLPSTARRVAAARRRAESDLSFDSRTRALEDIYRRVAASALVPVETSVGVPALAGNGTASVKEKPLEGGTPAGFFRQQVRVCFVIDRLRVAGTETQLLALIRGLDRRRVATHLCLLDGEDAISRSLEPADCPIIRLGVRSLHSPSALRGAWRLAGFLRANRVEVVQTYFPDSTYFAAPVARVAGVRHVVRSRRDLGFWMKPLDRWLGRLYSRIATATIANCEACRQAVVTQEGAPPESVKVLENGIDTERLLRIPSVSSTEIAASPRVGMVGNLRPVKGPDLFLRAAAVVAARFPSARFSIAGEGDEEGCGG